ncbi:Pyridoxine/pyridoxamine 5'-phosphate oxidase 2 [Platanthera guangdongensis]|uniref:pyridoxal 5'-phosphate synthase n=1 Tax=Platanthera guangdongensis TaxID=2320717 RepID=A0ABR2N022_9ASPA
MGSVRGGSTVVPSIISWISLIFHNIDSIVELEHTRHFILKRVGSVNGRNCRSRVFMRGRSPRSSGKCRGRTRSGSRKREEADHLFKCEICWYFTESWEQFRINGRIDVVDTSTRDLAKQQQREKSWFTSSLRSRLQYLGPSPRLPVLHEEPSTNHELDPLKGPVDTFCLLVFYPEQVMFPHRNYFPASMFYDSECLGSELCTLTKNGSCGDENA